MQYLQSFNRRLRHLREMCQFSPADVAKICGVDEAHVLCWEAVEARERSYPGVNELLALCLKTQVPLEKMLDMDVGGGSGQLELPGLAFVNSDDLSGALEELEREISRIQLSDEEAELLRRFRKTSTENRRMILQILGR